MDNTINMILQMIITGVVSIALIMLTLVGFKYLKAKAESIKNTTVRAKVKDALDMFEQAVISAVAMTNQTFVDSIKANRGLTLDESNAAFNKTKSSVEDILTKEVKSLLESTYNDIDLLYETTIEKAVSDAKK